jgi:formate hydrogenlyase subunit 4
MFNKFNALFFGPLGDDACYTFYLLSVMPLLLSFVIIFFILVAIINKRYSFEKSYHITVALPTLILSYFTNRLLYNMCMKTL